MTTRTKILLLVGSVLVIAGIVLVVILLTSEPAEEISILEPDETEEPAATEEPAPLEPPTEPEIGEFDHGLDQALLELDIADL